MSRRGPKFFYGWIVLTGLFVIMTAGSGFAFYAQGIFLKALVDEQGFSTTMASAGNTMFFVASGIGGYYTGGFIARYDVRWVMTIGTVLAAGAMAMLGQIRTEWHMFLVMGLFGAAYSLAGLVPTISVVTRWFHRRRGMAMAIASTGLSLGGIIISPVLLDLITEDSLVEWSGRFAIAYIVGVVPAVWLMVKPSPESIGQLPDGDPPSASAVQNGQPDELAGINFEPAVRSRYFIFVSIGFILIMWAQVGAIQHLVKLTSERVDEDAAQTALRLLAATSVVARIIGGFVTLKISLHRVTTALVFVQVVGIGIIATSSANGGILLGVLILGAAMGNLLMLHPLLLANAFGVRDYSRIYGFGSLLMIFGVALGPLSAGVLRDVGTYRTAYLALSVAGLLGGLVYLLAGRPPSADDYDDESGRCTPDIDLTEQLPVPRSPADPAVFLVRPL